MQLVAQGKKLVRQRGTNFARNLITASQCFKRALDLLPPDADRTGFAEIQYQLMGVEFEMAFHRDMMPQEKLSHLRSAEQHGWDASYNARQSTNSGLLAQVELYMAIIKGRSAEVNERLGVGPQQIRRQKDDVLSEIAIKIEKVRELRPNKLQESIDFADTWTKRLGPPPSPSAPAYSPPTPAYSPSTPAHSPTTSANITTPFAVELDASPRSSASAIPSFAELDISPRSSASAIPSFAELDGSGQLVTARYLQPEQLPAYH